MAPHPPRLSTHHAILSPPPRLFIGTLLALAFLVAGCDSADGTQETSADLPPALAQSDDTVLIGAQGSTKGDFLFHPVDIPPSGEFIVDLIGGPSPYSILASVLHRGLQDGSTEITMDLSGLGGTFAVEMRLDETVQYRSAPMEAAQTQPVGSLREMPTSYHFSIIEEGDEQVIVVAVDYDREAVGGNGVARITPEGEDASVPVNYLDVLPEQPLDASTEIAGVRMRGVGTGEIVIADQHIE